MLFYISESTFFISYVSKKNGVFCFYMLQSLTVITFLHHVLETNLSSHGEMSFDYLIALEQSALSKSGFCGYNLGGNYWK